MTDQPTHHDLDIKITRLEGKVDVMIERLDTSIKDTAEHRGDVRAKIESHETRLDGLTDWRNRLIGAYMALVVAWGAFQAWAGGHGQ